MTNAVPLLQLAAHSAGYNVSTGEVAAICAIAGAAVHIAHQAVAAYGRAGGYQGVVRFLKTGSTAIPADYPVATALPRPCADSLAPARSVATQPSALPNSFCRFPSGSNLPPGEGESKASDVATPPGK